MAESNPVTVRDLTPAEQARVKEALTKLRAPHEPGEPLDEDTFAAYRERRLKEEYPDVARLIGCE